MSDNLSLALLEALLATNALDEQDKTVIRDTFTAVADKANQPVLTMKAFCAILVHHDKQKPLTIMQQSVTSGLLNAMEAKAQEATAAGSVADKRVAEERVAEERVAEEHSTHHGTEKNITGTPSGTPGHADKGKAKATASAGLESPAKLPTTTALDPRAALFGGSKIHQDSVKDMVKGIGAMAVSRKQKENAPMKFTQEMGAPIAESGDLLGSPTTRDDYKPGVGHRDVLVAPEDAQKQAFKAWNQLQPTGQQSGGNALNQLQPTGQQSGGHAWHQPQPTGQQSGGHAWNKPQPIGQQSGGNAWKQPRPSGQQSGGNAWHQPQPTGQQVGGNASKNVSVLDEAEKAERRKRIAQVELEKFGTNDFEKNAIKGDEEEQEGKFDPFKYVDKHNRGGW